MNSQDEVEKLIELERNGHYTRHELYPLLTLLLDQRRLEEILRAMPEEIRADFVRWARETFDGSSPASDYVLVRDGRPFISSTGLVAIRAWLAHTSG